MSSTYHVARRHTLHCTLRIRRACCCHYELPWATSYPCGISQLRCLSMFFQNVTFRRNVVFMEAFWNSISRGGVTREAEIARVLELAVSRKSCCACHRRCYHTNSLWCRRESQFQFYCRTAALIATHTNTVRASALSVSGGSYRRADHISDPLHTYVVK